MVLLPKPLPVLTTSEEACLRWFFVNGSSAMFPQPGPYPVSKSRLVKLGLLTVSPDDSPFGGFRYAISDYGKKALGK